MTRLNKLKNWITLKLNKSSFLLEPISSDASFRRYFRVRQISGETLIAMDAPPATEDCLPFLKIADIMDDAGLKVPKIISSDIENGFMLLSDLGENTLLDIIKQNNADQLIKQAISILIKWQMATAPNKLPTYTQELLEKELDLFDTWFLGTHLKMELTKKEADQLSSIKKILVDSALSQPQVFVHRDFMLRNIMASPAKLGIIDFQDAVMGPFTYDLASLTKDAFISWRESDIDNWVKYYWQEAHKCSLSIGSDFRKFQKQLDLMAAQRHLKVLGIFSRICYRDKKPKYLADAPRFLKYLRVICTRNQELSQLGNLLKKI